MPRSLIDLLWRDHPDAPIGGARGPKARISTGSVVAAAIALADADGLAAVTIRSLATDLGVSTMSIYTHVNSRDDLLVLMADAAHGAAAAARGPVSDLPWRAGVAALAEANLEELRRRPWLLEIDDDRSALGPGTIAKYDRELAVLVRLGLDDVTTDAALTFVLDFVRSSARALRTPRHAAELAENWPNLSVSLADYLGDAYPLAQRVGAAAGEAMGGVGEPSFAWRFGLARLLDGLAALAQCDPSAQNEANSER
ncbi:TetR/AcrR family transcriptional regulator C-terminal domain-containing protein [Nocardioides sp. Bht2]|uniref:TetR/AcrR family transcriptional regulator C-terminal domain-containing protein n=1 Tax=Nocardioides sp. Bht2 TaxID=3392297 RepID=UPI0039B65948